MTPEEIGKEVGLWLLRNFPAAIVVGLLIELRHRWSKLLADSKWLRGKVRLLLEKHAGRHPDDAAELWREGEDDE